MKKIFIFLSFSSLIVFFNIIIARSSNDPSADCRKAVTYHLPTDSMTASKLLCPPELLYPPNGLASPDSFIEFNWDIP